MHRVHIHAGCRKGVESHHIKIMLFQHVESPIALIRLLSLGTVCACGGIDLQSDKVGMGSGGLAL